MRDQRASQRLLAVDGLLTFAFLGAIQALYGPLVPGLKQDFAITTSQAGLVFTAHGCGALLGILSPTFLRVRWLTSHGLGIASALLMLGAAGLLVAPSWTAMLGAAFMLALGFGIHVVRLNSLFVVGFGARGMTMSQLINAAFSVGSILGPIALSLSGGPSRGIYAGVALLALALLPLSLATDARVHHIGAAPAASEGPARRASGSRLVLAAFVLMLCLVSGAENSIAGWTTTLALARGYTYAEAANLTALFFAAILGGRLIAAWLGRRARAEWLAVAGIGATVLLLAIGSLTPIGPIAFALTGFALAPIFSATLIWVGSALPTSAHTNAVVIAGALLGAAVFPALIGRVIDSLGASAAPPAILAVALAALAAAAWLHFVRRA
jgi:FHS family glucose/mannose:H+ symporter-like MFS transporter